MYKFYSQNGEDYILWRVLQKRQGFFVDVGAFDGVYLSNSYYFESVGWHGICVEPHPVFFKQCKKNRRGSRCLAVACVGDDGRESVSFYAEEYGLYSRIDDAEGRQSNATEEYKDDVLSRYKNNQVPFSGFDKISVKAATLNSILVSEGVKPGDIDFVSIDTEGNELSILDGFDVESYQPRVVLIEANSTADDNMLSARMLEVGYEKCLKLGVNLFFAKKNSIYAQRLSDVCVACVLEPMMHPLGKEYTFPEYLERSVRLGGDPVELLERAYGYFSTTYDSVDRDPVEYEIYVVAESLRRELKRFQERAEDVKLRVDVLEKRREDMTLERDKLQDTVKRLSSKLDSMSNILSRVRGNLMGRMLLKVLRIK